MSASSKYRKVKRVPKGENFVQLTLAFLESEALKGLSLTAERALRRLMVEHLRHGGRDNGRLDVSYGQFVAAGCTRRCISSALQELTKRGLVKVIETGEWRGKTSRYELTFLNTEWKPSNEWKRFKGGIDAQGRLGHRSRASETPVPPSTRASGTPVPRASGTPSSIVSEGWVAEGRAIGATNTPAGPNGHPSWDAYAAAHGWSNPGARSDHDAIRGDGTPEPMTPAAHAREQAMAVRVGLKRT
jgi:hypothetical protein